MLVVCSQVPGNDGEPANVRLASEGLWLGERREALHPMNFILFQSFFIHACPREATVQVRGWCRRENSAAMLSGASAAASLDEKVLLPSPRREDFRARGEKISEDPGFPFLLTSVSTNSQFQLVLMRLAFIIQQEIELLTSRALFLRMLLTSDNSAALHF